MHRNSQNNNYRSYSYLPPSISTSSRNNRYQYYDPRLYNQQSSYSNTASTVAFTLSRFQQQFQSPTTIYDAGDPISVCDECRCHLSNRMPFNLNRRTSMNVTRFETASALRERMLLDIQHNISEIDYELSLLERRPVIQHRFPLRLSSIPQKALPSYPGNRIRPSEPKRTYEIIPSIPNQSKKITPYPSPHLTNQIVLPSFFGRYHYAPETEENVIAENDAENIDLISVVNEISELSFHQSLTLDEFRREQSPLPQNRALVFVPEFRGSSETKKDSDRKNPVDADLVQPPTVRTSQNLEFPSKLNTRNFASLFETEPDPKDEIASPRTPKPDEVDSAHRTSLKPVENSSPSTRMVTNIEEPVSSSQQTSTNPIRSNNDMNDHTAPFFSDYGNESATDEALISIYPDDLVFATESELITDHINDNDADRRSRASLSKQPSIELKNENVNETELPKKDAAKTYSITIVSTVPPSSTTSN